MVCFALASRALRRPFAPVQNNSDNMPVFVNTKPAPKDRTWHALQRACIRIPSEIRICVDVRVNLNIDTLSARTDLSRDGCTAKLTMTLIYGVKSNMFYFSSEKIALLSRKC